MTESKQGYDAGPKRTMVRASDWLGYLTLDYMLLRETLESLYDMGWLVKGWDAPKDKNIKAFSVTMQHSVKGPRREMVITLRTEWPRGEQPKTAVFVDKVSLLAYPEVINIVSLPVGDESDSTVTRDDPVATAASLSLYTDEEIWETYKPEARIARAEAAMRSSAANVLNDLLG